MLNLLPYDYYEIISLYVSMAEGEINLVVHSNITYGNTNKLAMSTSGLAATNDVGLFS